MSSVYIISSDKVFILGGRPLKYIMKTKVPRINPWATPCFIVPLSEKKF